MGERVCSSRRMCCSTGIMCIKGVFKTIVNAPGGVLFHCTAGKDRTGVVSAILLTLVGVSDEDIVYDYAISREFNNVVMILKTC